jgi:hypothetical protein
MISSASRGLVPGAPDTGQPSRLDPHRSCGIVPRSGNAATDRTGEAQLSAAGLHVTE